MKAKGITSPVYRSCELVTELESELDFVQHFKHALLSNDMRRFVLPDR